MQQDLVFSESGRELTAQLWCEIDHHTARRIRERIDEKIFLLRPEVLTIDFLGVRFMDSSGIGLILGRVEIAGAVGATVRIKGLSPTLTKLVRLSGVDRVAGLTIMK